MLPGTATVVSLIILDIWSVRCCFCGMFGRSMLANWASSAVVDSCSSRSLMRVSVSRKRTRYGTTKTVFVAGHWHCLARPIAGWLRDDQRGRRAVATCSAGRSACGTEWPRASGAGRLAVDSHTRRKDARTERRTNVSDGHGIIVSMVHCPRHDPVPDCSCYRWLHSDCRRASWRADFSAGSLRVDE